MITAKHNNKEYKIKFYNKDYSEGKINNQTFNLDIIEKTENSFHVLYKNKSYNLNILFVNVPEKTVSLKINHSAYSIQLTEEIDLLLNKMGIKNKTKQIKKELKAPMPGLVADIIVKEGDSIMKGETLLVLEAMKMENNLKAEDDVTIKKISIQKGFSVEKNEVLIVFE